MGSGGLKSILVYVTPNVEEIRGQNHGDWNKSDRRMVFAKDLGDDNFTFVGMVGEMVKQHLAVSGAMTECGRDAVALKIEMALCKVLEVDRAEYNRRLENADA
jgi:hypothetical protein